jgi:glycosyltransferase involved in cell wall biosynthesis
MKYFMDAYSVSTVITTYNRKRWVEHAIDSVTQQIYPPDEIIVVDDGSTDGSEQLIKRKFPQVRYLWQKNQGISASRNLGIRNASGKWIAFLDSDDTWLPRKLEKQIQTLKKNPEYLICHTDEIWIRRGRRVNPRKIHQKFGGDIFEKCLPLCLISPSSVLVHRQIFNRIGLFDTALPVCEDYDMWLRICAVYPVLYLDEPLLVKHGGHGDQLSKRYWGMDQFRIVALEKMIFNPALSNPKRIAAIEAVLQKMYIFIQGAQKRSKNGCVKRYQGKVRKYQNLLKELIG